MPVSDKKVTVIDFKRGRQYLIHYKLKAICIPAHMFLLSSREELVTQRGVLQQTPLKKHSPPRREPFGADCRRGGEILPLFVWSRRSLAHWRTCCSELSLSRCPPTTSFQACNPRAGESTTKEREREREREKGTASPVTQRLGTDTQTQFLLK